MYETHGNGYNIYITHGNGYNIHIKPTAMGGLSPKLIKNIFEIHGFRVPLTTVIGILYVKISS